MKKKPATSTTTKVKRIGQAVVVRQGKARILYLPPGWKQPSLERLINSRKFLRMNKEAYKARQAYFTAKGYLNEARTPDAVAYGQQLLETAVAQLRQFPELEILLQPKKVSPIPQQEITHTKQTITYEQAVNKFKNFKKKQIMATATKKKASKKTATKKVASKKVAPAKKGAAPATKKAATKKAEGKATRMVLSVDQINGIRKELVKGEMTYLKIKEKYGLNSFTPIAHIKKNKMVTKEDLK